MKTTSSAVPQQALLFIQKVADRENVYNADSLFPLVCQEIENSWPDEQQSIQAGKLRLGTTSQIKEAIYVFCQSGNWKDVLVDYHVMTNVSEGAIKLIHSIANRTHADDKNTLFDAVCDWLSSDSDGSDKSARRYARAKQMGLVTTNDLRYAIDLYYSYLKYGYLKKAKS